MVDAQYDKSISEVEKLNIEIDEWNPVKALTITFGDKVDYFGHCSFDYEKDELRIFLFGDWSTATYFVWK